jgi:hypothetical protein
MFPVAPSPRQHRYQQPAHQPRSTATSLADEPMVATAPGERAPEQQQQPQQQLDAPGMGRPAQRQASVLEQGDAVLLGTLNLAAAPLASGVPPAAAAAPAPAAPAAAELRQSAAAALGPLLASVQASMGTAAADDAAGLREALLQVLTDKQVRSLSSTHPERSHSAASRAATVCPLAIHRPCAALFAAGAGTGAAAGR